MSKTIGRCEQSRRTLSGQHHVSKFDLSASDAAYTRVRDGVTLIDSLVAWADITASLNADGDTDLVAGAIVTGHYFNTLGVRAAQGRLFSTTDDVTPGAHPVMVISDQAWMRPPRFGYSGEMDPDLLKNPNNGWLAMFALVMPGVSREQAQAELEALVASNRPPGAPPPDRRGPLVSLIPVDEGDPRVRRQLSSVAWLLAAVVGAVLLIACANVANLLLSKAAARRREVAVRLALGASRLRIVRQLLTESLLLALIGGAVGVALAFVLMQMFRLMPPPAGALPIALQPSLDRNVLAFSLGLSMITGVIFGVAPAWQTSRPDLVPALKDETSVVDRRGRRFNLKQGLVVVEVALAVVLLIGAGLFVRSLRAIQAIDPGIAASELVSAPININLLRYTKAQGRAFYRQLIERLEQIPGVSSASIARIADQNSL